MNKSYFKDLQDILDDFIKANVRYSEIAKQYEKMYKPDELRIRIEELKARYKEQAKQFKQAFADQVKKLKDQFSKDLQAAKYMSDPGFTNVVNILTYGGKNMDGTTIKNLVAPYLDDYIARKSIAAIIKEQGRDPEALEIDNGIDLIDAIKNIETTGEKMFDSAIVYTFPVQFSFEASPSVLTHMITRASDSIDSSSQGAKII